MRFLGRAPSDGHTLFRDAAHSPYVTTQIPIEQNVIEAIAARTRESTTTIEENIATLPAVYLEEILRPWQMVVAEFDRLAAVQKQVIEELEVKLG